jgi:hypothetical protein
MSVTYSESVSVVLVIQHAKRMRRIILPSVAFWLYHISPHYLIKVKVINVNRFLFKVPVVLIRF